MSVQTAHATLFANLASKNPNIKYGSSKQLLEIAQLAPATLLAEFDQIVDLLDSENNILKWTAIEMIGNLAAVDRDEKIGQPIVDKFFQFLRGGKLITANHAVAALAKIALAKPVLRKRIIDELLKTSQYHYETTECDNIVAGKVIDAFGRMIDFVKDNERIRSFAEGQRGNTRPATRRRAEKFLTTICAT
jgi:flagellar biosynthesis/type III secretory pathway ATPase